MKTVLVVSIVFLALSTLSFAQSQDSLIIPEQVMAAFTERFQDTSSVKWVELDESYQVEFLKLGDPFIAEFDKKGSWISSKETIMRRQVEDDLIDTAEEAYPDYNLERFFNFKSYKEEEFVIFELIKGDSTIYVKQGPNGIVLRL